MPVNREVLRRSIRIPLRVIDRVYGSDNADVAGDDIVNALREVSDYPGQFRYRYEEDASHPNPWYHALVFTIETPAWEPPISDATYSRFLGLLAGLGLVEST